MTHRAQQTHSLERSWYEWRSRQRHLVIPAHTCIHLNGLMHSIHLSNFLSRVSNNLWCSPSLAFTRRFFSQLTMWAKRVSVCLHDRCVKENMTASFCKCSLSAVKDMFSGFLWALDENTSADLALGEANENKQQGRERLAQMTTDKLLCCKWNWLGDH